MKDFLNIPKNRIIYKNDFFFVIEDKYPVSPGHLLIISNHLRADYFQLTAKEKTELLNLIEWCKEYLDKKVNPNGYNIGMNCGPAAGQTVFHYHCHIIPRFQGDIEHPEGGVRGVIPSKMKY